MTGAVDSLNIAVVGTGVIGAAWVSGFLAAGHTVTAFDPAPGAEDRLLSRLIGDPESEAAARSARFRFGSSLADAVSDVDFVQENGPERLEVKRPMLAEIAEATPPDAVIASSTSGFAPSEISTQVPTTPERIIVGHPFNPAHLVPLVEVVPNPNAPEEVVDRAMSIYRSIGKKPILVRAELPGHVVNRLQAALWQEAYSLVDRGVVSVEDIDTAISYGPGLRWAILGPLALQHLSGGEGGMQHVLDHLGPPQEKWMHDLKKVHLDDRLKAELVAGVDAELAGRDEKRLAAQRDSMLRDLLELKHRYEELP